MFEVEFRSRFDSRKYKALKAYLDQRAEKLGSDNKDCYYYIFSDKLLKIVHNTSKKTAKISLKLNRIGEGAVFPEIELYFSPEQFETARELLNKLDLPAKIMHGPQERINYRYQNCEISLKYSDAWGHHMEIEQVIDQKKKSTDAEKHIRQVAEELGIKLMSEEELKEFTRRAESQG